MTTNYAQVTRSSKLCELLSFTCLHVIGMLKDSVCKHDVCEE